MKNIGTSEFLILASCIFAFSNTNLAIAALALGTIGGFVKYAIQFGEKQQKAKSTEEAVENFGAIIYGLASGVNKQNLH